MCEGLRAKTHLAYSLETMDGAGILVIRINKVQCASPVRGGFGQLSIAVEQVLEVAQEIAGRRVSVRHIRARGKVSGGPACCLVLMLDFKRDCGGFFR